MCCGKQFGYYLIHSGFNESAYAYCDQCGETCLLDLWRLPSTVERMDQGIIPESLEPLLVSCKCGGAFRKEASPRANCNSNLSAERGENSLKLMQPERRRVALSKETGTVSIAYDFK